MLSSRRGVENSFQAMPSRSVRLMVDRGFNHGSDDRKHTHTVFVERVVYREPPKPAWNETVMEQLDKQADRPFDANDAVVYQCQACQENTRCIVLGECGHCTTCKKCTIQLVDMALVKEEKGISCPICRKLSTNVCRVWL